MTVDRLLRSQRQREKNARAKPPDTSAMTVRERLIHDAKRYDLFVQTPRGLLRASELADGEWDDVDFDWDLPTDALAHLAPLDSPAEPPPAAPPAPEPPPTPAAPAEPPRWYEEKCGWRERTKPEDFDFGDAGEEGPDDPLGLYQGEDE